MTRRERIEKRKRRKIKVIALKGLLVLAGIIIIAAINNLAGNKVVGMKNEIRKVEVVEKSNQASKKEVQTDKADVNILPDTLKNLYDTNEDAREFVLGYWENKDKFFTIDLSKYENCSEVPHLMQWDKRWGYEDYSGDLFGITGCGPTCLSMAAIYLLQDTTLNPKWMKRFSERRGYSVEGNGSAWTLISEGGKELGLSVEELSLSESVMSSNLSKDSLIIAVLGPGDFTRTGHFIVITDYDGEGFTVKDPNSYKNTEKKWTYEELSRQIRNLWVLSKM